MNNIFHNVYGVFLADTRALSLRLFTEIASVYLNEGQFDTPQQKVSSKPLDEIISQVLLPQWVIVSLLVNVLFRVHKGAPNP